MTKNRAVYAQKPAEGEPNRLSVQQQFDICQAAAGDVPLVLYQDKNFDGQDGKRPNFSHLLEDIKEDKISKLYVCHIDYFAQSISEFSVLWDILQEHNVPLVSVGDDFDTSTRQGVAALNLLLKLNKLEWETTSKRVRNLCDTRASLGGWIGGPAPYGFSLGRKKLKNKKEISVLVPVKSQKAIIQRIFEEYAKEDVSLGLLARELNYDGIPCAKRSCWDNVSLSRLLHNPVYVNADEQVLEYYAALGVNIISPDEAFDGKHGLLLYGKRRSSDRKYTSVENQNLAVLNSPGIVSAALFISCQKKLENNAQLKNAGKGKHTWLSGLMKCADCGYSISVMKEQNGHRRLNCSGRYNLRACKATIRVDLTEMENAIAEVLQRILETKHENVIFADLDMEQKKSIAAKFIERVDVGENDFDISYKETMI